MLGKVAPFIGASCLLGCYITLRQYPIKINNPYLGRVFKTINQYNSSYSLVLLKALLRMKVLSGDQSFKQYVLGPGFDTEGKYIEQVYGLGFKGLQIGPISSNATQPEDVLTHLGFRYALANICSFHQNNPDNNFEVHVNLVPNAQVIKYTPYILRENIVQPVHAYQEIQEQIPNRLISRINIQYDHPQQKFQGREEPEVRKMVRKLQEETKSIIEGLNEKLQNKITVIFEAKREKCFSWPDMLSFIINESQL